MLFHTKNRVYDPKVFTPCWVLTHTRTGSTYLCYLLNNTKLFGNRQKHNPLDGYFFNIWGEYFHSTIYKGEEEFAKNPPLKAKVHRHHFLRCLSDDKKQWIETLLPGIKYVLLRRKDAVAHAVSRYFARATNTHHCNDEDKLQAYQETKVYLNKYKLLGIYQDTLKCYHDWDNYLINSDFLDLEYEDLINNPTTTISLVLNYLGIKYTEENVNLDVPLRKLEHPQKQEFIEILNDLIGT